MLYGSHAKSTKSIKESGLFLQQHTIKDEIKDKLATLVLQPVILGKPFGMNEWRVVLELIAQLPSEII